MACSRAWRNPAAPLKSESRRRLPRSRSARAAPVPFPTCCPTSAGPPSSVVSRWREIVGERYAGVSTPESIRFPNGRRSDGVLTLVVEGAHAPMMQHVAPVIVERVNRFFGYPAVERVTFKQGIVKVAKAKARVAPPALRPIPAELGDSLRVIADPELRACLESLARGVAASEGQPIETEVTAIPVVGRLTR